ncbi:flagellar export protein FliJ [Candidatus Aerophobetes bacterium]|nr:flagellar export protein FliJ [Candidatus Aerophobetes bacterium]
MKKFSFSLQFLLDNRKRREDILKRKLAQIIAREKREREILKMLEERMIFYQNRLKEEEMKKRLKVALAILYYAYIEKLNGQVTEQKERIKQVSIEKEKLRGELIRVSRERRLLERLREKRWEEFVELTSRAQQKFIDEGAIIRFYHKVKKQI